MSDLNLREMFLANAILGDETILTFTWDGLGLQPRARPQKRAKEPERKVRKRVKFLEVANKGTQTVREELQTTEQRPHVVPVKGGVALDQRNRLKRPTVRLVAAIPPQNAPGVLKKLRRLLQGYQRTAMPNGGQSLIEPRFYWGLKPQTALSILCPGRVLPFFYVSRQVRGLFTMVDQLISKRYAVWACHRRLRSGKKWEWTGWHLHFSTQLLLFRELVVVTRASRPMKTTKAEWDAMTAEDKVAYGLHSQYIRKDSTVPHDVGLDSETDDYDMVDGGYDLTTADFRLPPGSVVSFRFQAHHITCKAACKTMAEMRGEEACSSDVVEGEADTPPLSSAEEN